MRLKTVAAVSALAVTTIGLALPAMAQPRRNPPANQTERITVVDETGRRTTRITVRPRSFLDPGTATRSAFEYHYSDYAVPPNYSIYYDRTDWKGSWQRMPFPAPFDVPGSGWNRGF
jgi:hypothetical protein